MSSSGGRPPSVSDEQIIQYLRESGERVLTTPEIADGLDVSRRTALRRLSALANEGRVERKDVGGRTAVWWVPDDDRPTDIDPDDPLFTGEPLLAPEDPIDETEIDDVLYSEAADE